MNYLLEINAFERRMRRAPLSTTAQLLWYKLMQFANGLYWPEKFQVDNVRLLGLLNVTSKNTLIAARKELTDDGLITFSPGVRGKPSIYHLASVAALEGPDIQPMDEPPESDAFLYEVKEDITTYFGYTEALGQELQQITETIWAEYHPGQRPTPGDVQQVFEYIYLQEQQEDESWEMNFPEEKKELLAYAFDQARQGGNIAWNYVKGIYKNFGRRGISTVRQAVEYEFERDQRSGGI